MANVESADTLDTLDLLTGVDLTENSPLFNTFSIKDRIYEYLNSNEVILDDLLADKAGEIMSWAVRRQLMTARNETKPGQLRGSNAGPCARKIAYGYLGFEPDGKDIDARAKLTFLNGDLLEVVVVLLTKMVGVQVRGTCMDTDGQIDLELDLGDTQVPGHPDGVLEIQPGVTEEHLYEVKSASDYSFKNKFAKGLIDDGYMLQHHVYMEALGLRKGVFLAINKNSGDLTEVWTEYDPDFVEWAKHNYTLVLGSRPNKLPTRYYGEGYGVKKSKKGVYTLAPLCGYCAYRNECFKTTVEVVKGKPVYTLTELPEDLPEEFR